MGLNQAMNISLTAIKAERTQMEVIASNLANVNTTRTVNGGPYRRKVVVFGEKPISFSEELSFAQNRLEGGVPGGVEVADIIEDVSPFPKVYNPGHPDADANGFVSLPNVSLSKEMVDLVYNSKLYEANITAYNASKKMAQDTLNLP